MADAKISGFVDRLSARERSGYVIDNFSSSVEFGLVDGALFEDLHLRDPWSDLRLRSLSLDYGDLSDMSDFVNRIGLEAELQRSSISLQTLAYFTGSFIDSPLILETRRGHVSGLVNDLLIDRLVFAETTTGVSSTVDARITGLPDLENTHLDAKLTDLTGTTTAISGFLGGLSPDKPAPNLGSIAHNVPLTIQAKATGPFNNLDVDVLMQSAIGEFTLTGQVSNVIDPVRPIDLALNLATRELDLGDVLGVDFLGAATIRTSIRAILGSSGLPDARLDSLHIDRIRALGHDFHDIRVTGSLNDGVAEGRIQSADPLLRLDLSGLADLEPHGGKARYRIDGNIS